MKLPFMIPMKVWVWLSFLAFAVAGLNELLVDAAGLVILPASAGRLLALLGGAALAYRKLKDDNHNGIPDIFESEAWTPPTEASKVAAKQEQLAKVMTLLVVVGLAAPATLGLG